MAHEQEFDLRKHLQIMAATFAIIGTIIAGMISSMMILIIDGIIVSTSEAASGGHDFDDYLWRVGPLTLLTFIVIELLVVRMYFSYAARVRRDPSQRIEL